MSALRWLRYAFAELGDALRGPCPQCAVYRRELAAARADLEAGVDELARAWELRAQSDRGAALAIAAATKLQTDLAECRSQIVALEDALTRNV